MQKRLLIITILLFVSGGYSVLALDINKSSVEMKNFFRIKSYDSEKVGFAGSRSPNYDLYSKTALKLSRSKLISLLKHKNPTVVETAFQLIRGELDSETKAKVQKSLLHHRVDN